MEVSIQDGSVSEDEGQTCVTSAERPPKNVHVPADASWPADTSSEVQPDPPVRGERILESIERAFLYLNRLVHACIPRDLNPFTQMGAVANTTFIIALVSGVLLLFWYSPSVHQAYSSVAQMQESPYLAGLLRSLHRYSSDACMLFVLLHGLHVLSARRFSGGRWVGWVSGALLIGFLWLVGWTGYWLVWDETARQIALATALVFDVIPIFPEPLSRSFLTDEGVNSLLFFIVFFIHMMIPLAMGILLWVHIMRLNEARFLTPKGLTGVILVVLVALSLVEPAISAGPARMAEIPSDLPLDWYYLLPTVLTDRLHGGIVWLAALMAGVAAFSVPWTLTRRRPEPAVVDPEKCNGCTQCFQDCPYNAITMVPDANARGKKKPFTAFIDPAKCVGCGICVGSCDPVGISQESLSPLDVRRWINQHASEPLGGIPSEAASTVPEFVNGCGDGAAAGAALTAFVCSQSGAAAFEVDADGVCDALPGYRVAPVPCIGWVHPLLIERARKRGSAGVLLVGCDADPNCRLGAEWMAARLTGEREPALRTQHVDSESVHLLRCDRISSEHAASAAREFRAKVLSQPRSDRAGANIHEGSGDAGRPGGPVGAGPRKPRWPVRLAGGVVLVIVLSALTLLPGRLPYTEPDADRSELVISFKLAGKVVEDAGDDEERREEEEQLLPHMRRPRQIERRRLPIRMKVLVDGRTVVDRIYEPGGLFGDGSTIAMEKIVVDRGAHEIDIMIDDAEGGEGRESEEPDVEKEWSFASQKHISFSRGRRHVVLFEREKGFTWY